MAAGMRQRSALLPLLLAASAVAVLMPGLLGFVHGALRPQVPARPLVAMAADAAAPRSAPAEDAAVTDAKARLMDLLADDMLEEEVLKAEGKAVRGRMDEAITQLEKLNPSEEPVYSLDLDGTWIVKYAGTIAPGLLSSPTRELALFLYGGGFSLGNALSSFANGAWGQNLGVKLGQKTVRIQGGRDVDASAEIEVAGRKQKLMYTGELMPLSARRMSEEVTVLDLPSPIGRQDLPFELRRSILITYLDNEVMIVRDESGVPEVLVREAGEDIKWTEEEPLQSANETAAAGNATAAAGNATASQ